MKQDTKKELINIEELNQVCESDNELISILMETFLQESHETLANLRQAIISKDFGNIRFYAHRLKGGATTIAAMALFESSLELEKAADTLQTESIEDIFSRVEKDLQELTNYLQEEWKTKASH